MITVQLEGVSKWYHAQSRVLDQIHLELRKGDFIYVTGGTGAGKSSLLRLIATEEPPSTGRLSLFGYPLASASPSTLCAIRRSLGYVPQDVRLIPDLTVFENVALSVSLAARGGLSQEARKRIQELLERLGLAQKRNAQARSLSGGEAQRVAVARAFARKPELVVADEPTGAQDGEHTWSLMDLFLRANLTGATVIVATHDREIIRRVRKPCAFLRSGGLTLPPMVGELPCTY